MGKRTKINFGWHPSVPAVAMLLIGVISVVQNCSAQIDQADGYEKPLEHDFSDAAFLSEFWIEASIAGIQGYLDSLLPSDGNVVAQAQRIAAKLSDEDYQVREQATRDLAALPGISIATLKSIESDSISSPEGRYRLQAVIEERSTRNDGQIQFLVLNLISEKQLHGMTETIVNVHAYLETSDFVQNAVASAIQASSNSDDLEVIERVLNDSQSPVALKVGCLGGLSRISPEKAVVVAQRMDAPTGKIGLAVAKVLIENKEPNSIDVLSSLLDDEQARVKFTALSVLRLTTGLSFANNYLANKASVSKAQSQIASWLEDNNEKINYRWPKSVRLGRRLVSHYNTDKVVELDESNKIVWSIKCNKPFACLGLPNGHRMVVHYISRKLVEYDATGKEVKTIIDLPDSASGFCRQADGTIWAAAGQAGNQIVKISVDGEKVKGFNVPGTPTSVELGLNGNLICALYSDNQIVELNTDGKVLRSFTVKGDPYHAQPLQSGSYLVAFPKDGRIVEYARDGKLMWKHKCDKNVYRAQELEDGSIVFSDSKGFHRINRAGASMEFKDLSDSGEINYSFSY